MYKYNFLGVGFLGFSCTPGLLPSVVPCTPHLGVFYAHVYGTLLGISEDSCEYCMHL